MKKCIILAMSCCLADYKMEEDSGILTWADDIVNGKYEGLSVYFYKGGQNINLTCGKDMFLTADDASEKTYDKTIAALEAIKYMDYDYVVKTNASTYINSELLYQFINSEYINDEDIYGGRCVITSDNYFCPFFRGDFILFSKKIADDILNAKINYGKSDDAFMFLSLALYYKKEGQKDITLRLKEIECIEGPNEINDEKFVKSLYIRCKSDTVYATINLFWYFKKFINDNHISFVLEPPRNITTIETFYGIINKK